MQAQGALSSQSSWSGGREQHGSSNYSTVSKKHKDEKHPREAQKESQREKRTKRNPEVLRRRKAEVKTHGSA